MLQVESTRAVTLRERNVAQRRQRILDGARRIIATDGIAALSMRRLADESGLAVKTLYNLWGGRRAILEGLTEQAVERMEQAMAREAPDLAPIERCEAIITLGVQLMVSDHAVYRPMVLAAYQGFMPTPEHRELVSGRASTAMASAIRAGIAAGHLRDTLDPDLLGRQIYHGYEMALSGWAFAAIDDDAFLAAALYALHVALLGIASDATRPAIEDRIHLLEVELRNLRYRSPPPAGP